VERAGRQKLSAPAGLLVSCHLCQLVRLLLSSTLCPATRELLSCAKPYAPLQAMSYIPRLRLWGREGIPVILNKETRGDGVG